MVKTLISKQTSKKNKKKQVGQGKKFAMVLFGTISFLAWNFLVLDALKKELN